MMLKEPKPITTKPTGVCPRCGRFLDDHDGWLTKEGPRCPAKKERQ